MSFSRWPYEPPPPNPSRSIKPSGCQWYVCDGTITIRAFPKVWITLDDDMLALEDTLETWLCFNHENMLKTVQRRLPHLQIRRSREGWIYVDNLNYLLFST